MTTDFNIPTKPAKAVVAAVGATLTAVTSAWATVTVAMSDDAIDVAEVGSLVTLALSLAGTVWGVWKTRNAPKHSE